MDGSRCSFRANSSPKASTCRRQAAPSSYVPLQASRCAFSRPKKDGSEAVILDHVGNVLRHGLAEEPRNWTLEGRSSKKRTKEAVLETRQCETCFCIFAGLKCPECGVERASKVREIEQREGELRELEIKQMAEARAARIEVGRAQSYEALVAIEKARGYKRGWAFHRWRASRHKPANNRANNRAQNPSHKQTA